MRKPLVFFLLVVAWLAMPTAGHGQSISEVLSKIAGDNAKNYIQPAVDAFGANLNSGLYYTADVHGVLGFDIGLRAMVVFVPDDQLKFVAVLPDSVVGPGGTKIASGYPRNHETATVWGGKGQEGVQSTNSSVPPFPFPGGVDLKTVPLAVPQLSVGLPLGTEILLRYLPTIKISESIGKLSFFGIGLRHDIDQYIPVPGFPIDISAQFVYQSFSVKDTADRNILDTKAISLGAQVSKTFAIATLYGGIAYENTAITIGPYQHADPSTGTTITINAFDVTAKNNFRFTVGAGIKLAIINLNIDYSLASTSVLSAGLSLGLR